MTSGEHLEGRGTPTSRRRNLRATTARRRPLQGAAIGSCSRAITFVCVAGAAATRPATDAKGTPRYRFDGNTVLDLARRTAGSAFVPKRLENPALQQLNYDQYRDIRFNPEAADLAQRAGAVSRRAVPGGLPVPDAGDRIGRRRRAGARHRRRPNTFMLGNSVAKQLANQTLPLSGFRVRTRLNSRSVWDEFLVFQGASYFRAVARDTLYGFRRAALRYARRIRPAKSSRRSRTSGSSGRRRMRRRSSCTRCSTVRRSPARTASRSRPAWKR